MQVVSTCDGGNSAGLGSLLQIQQHLYAFCKLNGYEFGFPGFTRLSHYQYTDHTQQEFCNKINRFVGVHPLDPTKPQGIVDEHFLLHRWGEEYNAEKKEHIKEFFKFVTYEDELYFDKDKPSVALHIRTLNSQDNCHDPNREYYRKGSPKEEYFDTLLQHITSRHEELDIHIFSQGQAQEFSLLTDKYGAHLHLDDDIVRTLYHLTVADFLLASNSSLSWCSHLYAQNKKVYAKNNFFHSWYPDTIIVDDQGNF